MLCCRRPTAFALWILLLHLGGCAAVGQSSFEDLSCASGLTHQTTIVSASNARIDSCIDENGWHQGIYRSSRLDSGKVEYEYSILNNKRHGTARTFDSDGNLCCTSEFLEDKEVSVKCTPKLVEKTLAELNEMLKSKSVGIKATLIQKDVARFTVDAGAFKKLRLDSSGNPLLQVGCKLIRWSGATVTRVEVFIQEANGTTRELASVAEPECPNEVANP